MTLAGSKATKSLQQGVSHRDLDTVLGCRRDFRQSTSGNVPSLVKKARGRRLRQGLLLSQRTMYSDHGEP